MKIEKNVVRYYRNPMFFLPTRNLNSHSEFSCYAVSVNSKQELLHILHVLISPLGYHHAIKIQDTHVHYLFFSRSPGANECVLCCSDPVANRSCIPYDDPLTNLPRGRFCEGGTCNGEVGTIH